MRSNASVQTATQEEAAATASTGGPRRSSRRARKEVNNEDPPTTATSQDGTTSKKTATRRRSNRKSATMVTEEDAEADGGAQEDESQEGEKAAAKPRRRRRRKKTKEPRREYEVERQTQGDDGKQAEQEEESDESDPELHEIDPNTVRLYEISYDKRNGKTSEREKKMAEIDWVEVARKRHEALEKAAANSQPAPTTDIVETTEGPTGTAEPPSTTVPAPPEGSSTVAGVRFRIVNGQIIEDEATLTIDRQAQAQAEALTTTEPIEEESDLTTRINRTTWINERRRSPADRVPMWRRKSDPWTEVETDRFYDALRMFGTDFMIISKMFAPKTRHQIKTKFVREERLDPARINAALLGLQSKPMDLEHYAREVGRDVAEYTKYAGVEEADEVIRASMGEKREAMQAAIVEEQEMERAREEAAKMKRGGRGKKGAEGGRKGAGKGSRKKKGGATLGGAPAVEEGGGGGRGVSFGGDVDCES